MNFDQFQAALLAFLFIPQGQKERSLAIGKVLQDADRLEFCRHLQDIDRQLKETAEGEDRVFMEAEGAVVAVEHRLIRFEREGREEAERVEEMKTVEAQISPLSHG